MNGLIVPDTRFHVKMNELIVPDTRFQIKISELIVPDTRFQIKMSELIVPDTGFRARPATVVTVLRKLAIYNEQFSNQHPPPLNPLGLGPAGCMRRGSLTA